MTRLRVIMIILMFLLTTNFFISAADKKDELVSLRERVDDLLSEFNRADKPGVALVIARDGKIVYLNGLGSANLEYNLPITVRSVFDVGSIAVQFTSMAIAMLEDQGILSLKDDIRKYIPEIPDFGKIITIRHLLHHISGIRDWPQALALTGWKMDDVITAEQILKAAMHQQELDFDPGTEFLYSNTGYNLLAEIVHRATGVTFRTWMWENIFKPLGMTSTHIRDKYQEIVPNRVYSYHYHRREGYLKAVENLAAPGPCSLYSTVEDLGKWLLNLESGNVGGVVVIQKMHMKGILNSGEEIGYALGLNIGEYIGFKRLSHSGVWAGFESVLHYYPEQKFGVVVLCNMDSYDGVRLAEAIADIYLKGHLKEKKEKIEQLVEKRGKVDPEIYNQFEGKYRLALPFDYIINIIREGNSLIAQESVLQKYKLCPESQGKFFLREWNGCITFQKDEKGEVSRFNLRVGRRNILARKIKISAMNPGEMDDFTGTYCCDELDAHYNVIIRDGQLVVTNCLCSDIKLKVVDQDQFVGDKWFFPEVIFIRDGQRKITGFKVTGIQPGYFFSEHVTGVKSDIIRGYIFLKKGG